MEMKITEAETKEAIDYWLRQIHPTLMAAKEITKMVISQYPLSIVLSIGEKPNV